jgi:beta-lactamase regulating signal transducer with metallopeptidase domain
MTQVGWMNVYLCANVLVALAVVLSTVVGAAGAKLRRPISFRHRLAIAHALLAAAALLPFVALFSGQGSALPRTAQIWSAPTMNAAAAVASADHRIAISLAPDGSSLSLAVARDAAAGLIAIGVLVSLFRLARDVRTTARIVARAQTIRRLGRLNIRVSDEIHVPFSFWVPTRYFIVVPIALVLDRQDLEMAIRHEAQHHRQQDTKWLYLYQLLRALFFWNPAVHVFERHLRSLQEFACDEALSARGPIVDAQYCRSLLRVAEAATLSRPLIRASMLDDGGPLFLKRRIEAVLLRPAAHQRKAVVGASAVIVVSLLAMTALAFGQTIRDRRITTQQAAGMAELARETGAVALAVNDRVVRQLNLLTATPDGRAYLRASLARMQSYEQLISDELARHKLPLELLAVPLVESGYRNVTPGGGPRHGAGLWMFIEATARRFGLTVNASLDERLDAAAQTRAAAQYFAELYSRFGDWNLAILAYNAGAARVEAGIQATASRDVWQLIAAGYENNPDYVARVTAAMLIMRNPSVLD